MITQIIQIPTPTPDLTPTITNINATIGIFLNIHSTKKFLDHISSSTMRIARI